VLLWVVPPTSRLGPPYAATRVVRPSPPRSRESWCSRRFLAPDILFPQDACNTNYRAPEFVDRVYSRGSGWGSGTPETRAQARNGSARVRVTTGSQIALAGDSVILSAAEHFLRFVVNRQSKSQEPYFFTAMACNSKCPPRRSDPAPMNSRAGKSLVVK